MFRSAFHVIILSIILLSTPLSAQDGIKKVATIYNYIESVQGVVIVGDHVFIATGLSGLQVLDISDPENPELVGNLEIDEWSFRIYNIGDYVYILHRSKFSVINISDPTNLRYIRSVATPRGSVIGFDLYEDKAVITTHWEEWNPDYEDWEGNLALYDIQRNDNPRMIFHRITGTPDENWIAPMQYCLVRGDLVYFSYLWGDAYSVLDFYDINEPELIAGLRIPADVAATNSDNNLLFAYSPDGVYIIDVDDLESPELVSEFNDLGRPLDLVLDNTNIFATFPDSSFGIIDVSDPESPQQIANLRTEKRLSYLDIGDEIAALISYPRELLMIGLEDVETPEISGTFSFPEGAVHSIDKVGNLLYVALTPQGLSVVNVENVNEPYEIGRIETPPGVTDVEVENCYAFIACGDSGMYVMDVRNPQEPDIVGHLVVFEDSVQAVLDITIGGNYACLLTEVGIKIVDIEDPAQPRIVGRIGDNRYWNRIQVEGDIIYLSGTSSGSIRVFDISDRSAPEYLYWFPACSRPNNVGVIATHGFKIIGNYLITCVSIEIIDGRYNYWRTEIHIMDISDPEDIHFIGSRNIDGEYLSVFGFTVNHDYAYSVIENTLQIWDISNPENIFLAGSHLFPGHYQGLEIDVPMVYAARHNDLSIYDCSEVVSVSEKTETPYEFSIDPPYPNPFNSTTTISYQLPAALDVSLCIFDITGREVTTLVRDRIEAGKHQIVWNGTGVPSGIYICRLSVGEYARHQKLALVK
ncbi:T9SS type A sorting domain-containing protein [bacterium]|nr:T9SS type A sorting domain-containing protein [bacterium]